MGPLALVLRLASKDLRHTVAESLLLLVGIATAAATLTMALGLHGVTSHPYQLTRQATRGPDIVAASLHGAPLASLSHAPGVTASSGPYLIADPNLMVDGHTDPVMAEGRASTIARVDQPKLTAGTWVRPGGVVVERSLAELLGLRVGETVQLGHGPTGPTGGPPPQSALQGPSTDSRQPPPPARSLRVDGIAVTAALLPAPYSDFAHPSGFPEAGLVWVTAATARELSDATGGPFAYTLNLRLADPSSAPGFVDAHRSGSVSLISWQAIESRAGEIVSIERAILLTGSSLLGLLALACVALLVGGRMEEETRRVGLLKAVGATPAIVTAVLLAEQLALAVASAAVGLVTGWALAPLLTNPGASLLGAPGAPTIGPSSVGLVLAATVGLALLATAIPAVRAARMSTVDAIADAPRPARRGRLSIALSSHLPVPLLLGVRLASRRRRRAVLSAASIALTVGALVTVLMFREHAHSLASLGGLYRFSGPSDPLWERGSDVMAVFTVAMVLLAFVNAVLVTWATVQEVRHTTAVERALGASPGQTTASIVAAQLLSALPGALLGVPVGVGLYVLVGHHNSTLPSAVAIIGVVLLVLVVTACLTALPARFGMRRSVSGALQAE